MPTRKARLHLAMFLSQHLISFGEGFDGYLLCPTCMKKLHVDTESDKFTVGHIVPEAAGGKDWTILCKVCNSNFGSLQDKWFGEYLSILNNPEGTFFHAKSKGKYITVNGVKVSGTVCVSEENGDVEVFLPINRNPPGKIDSIPHLIGLEVEFTPLLIQHFNEIQTGYITAAYLLWFKVMGYNWIMQSSLELVRKQILECNYMLHGAKVTELQDDEIHEPDIGIISKSGFFYPCCLMYDRMVIFPAPNGSKAPSPQSLSFSDTCDIHFLNLGVMDTPYSVSFEGEVVVLPDMLKKKPNIPEHMLNIFADAGREAQWLRLENRYKAP